MSFGFHFSIFSMSRLLPSNRMRMFASNSAEKITEKKEFFSRFLVSTLLKKLAFTIWNFPCMWLERRKLLDLSKFFFYIFRCLGETFVSFWKFSQHVFKTQCFSEMLNWNLSFNVDADASFQLDAQSQWHFENDAPNSLWKILYILYLIDGVVWRCKKALLGYFSIKKLWSEFIAEFLHSYKILFLNFYFFKYPL